MKYSEVATKQGQHVCIYGNPKSGKSTLVANLATAGYNLKWLSLDGGFSIISKLPREYWDNNDVINLPDTASRPVGFGSVRAILKGLPTYVCTAHGQAACSTCKRDNPYPDKVSNHSWNYICLADFTPADILVIDPGSSVVESAIAYITTSVAKKGRSGGKNSESLPPNSPLEDVKFEFEDWRKLAAMMHEVLSDIQTSHCNIIFITHALEVDQETGGKIIVPLIGSTNFSVNSAKYFDHVIYTEVRLKHLAGSSSTYKAGVITGSRTDISLEKMPVASLETIFNYTKEKLGVDYKPANPINHPKDERKGSSEVNEASSEADVPSGDSIQQSSEGELAALPEGNASPERNIEQAGSSPAEAASEGLSTQDKMKIMLEKLRAKS